jgi:hypothetical protein
MILQTEDFRRVHLPEESDAWLRFTSYASLKCLRFWCTNPNQSIQEPRAKMWRRNDDDSFDRTHLGRAEVNPLGFHLILQPSGHAKSPRETSKPCSPLPTTTASRHPGAWTCRRRRAAPCRPPRCRWRAGTPSGTWSSSPLSPR